MEDLASAYDKYAGEELLAMPELPEDTVRRSIDSAVIRCIPDLSETVAEMLRQKISEEPSVTNR